jgi:hypothetical protein
LGVAASGGCGDETSDNDGVPEPEMSEQAQEEEKAEE